MQLPSTPDVFYEILYSTSNFLSFLVLFGMSFKISHHFRFANVNFIGAKLLELDDAAFSSPVDTNILIWTRSIL
jgi:hypothetical protein